MARQNFQEIQHILAGRINEARNELGLSQEELADASAIDRTYVSQLERSLVNPSLSVLVRVASALNVDVIELLE